MILCLLTNPGANRGVSAGRVRGKKVEVNAGFDAETAGRQGVHVKKTWKLRQGAQISLLRQRHRLYSPFPALLDLMYEVALKRSFGNDLCVAVEDEVAFTRRGLDGAETLK